MSDVSDADRVAELPGIALADGLHRTGGNRGLYRALLREFAREFSHVPQQIRSVLTECCPEDLPAIRTLVHGIRGMAGNLAAQELSRVSRDLEQAIRAERREEWPELLDRFVWAMQQVLDSIPLLAEVEPLEEEAVVTDPVPDLERVIPLLRRLTQQIASGSVDALTSVQTLKSRLRGSGMDSALQQLDRCINRFDFDGAQETLQAIVQALHICLESDG